MPKSKETESAKITALDQDILTVLLGRKLYGLEILGKLNKPAPDKHRPIPLSFGSLYPALNRLEKKGYVSWSWGNEQEGTSGARRKYYEVTAEGAKALQEVQDYRILLSKEMEQGQMAIEWG